MYLTFDPQPPLDRYISCYWMIRPPDARQGYLEELIIPDGQSDLVLCLGAPYVRTTSGSHPEEVEVSTNLDAARAIPIRIQQRGVIDVVGIRFRMGGLSAFQPAALHELTGGPVDAAAVFGSDISILEERLLQTPTPSARVEILNAFLRRRLVPSDQYHLVASVLHIFMRSTEQDRISKAAEMVGYSRRTLRRAFRHLVGHSPKTCARIIRFHQAWQTMCTDVERSLTDIAFSCGYYDQPHFTREFKRFTGMTPGEYKSWMLKRGLSRAPINVRNLQAS